MPEILSQNQIDELLRKLSGDEVDGEEPAGEDLGDKKVKLYNFKNPKKLTRDQQKVLRGISEIFARHLASYMAGLTRSYCEVSVASLEEQPYMEYNNALPDMLITGVLDMNILKGALLLDFSNPITFALIERMFGGSMSAREVPSREFTDIETTLMERILKRITVLFQEAWSYPPNVDVSVRQVETNTRFIKAIAMDEVVVVMVLSVRLNTVKGTISCCIPCIGIGQTLDEILSAQEGRRHTLVTDDDSDEETQKAVLTQLEGSDIDFRGVLGTATITMEEMINLQVGDVIRLDQSVGTPIQISVNGKNWFLGEPGIKKNKVAVLITQQYAG